MTRDPIEEAEELWRSHGWGEAAEGMAIVTTLTRVQQLLHQRIDALLRPDLSFARYEILMLLLFSRRGSLPMSVVGSRLQVHPASVTSAVERLERDGFVVREKSVDDGRRVLARLTPAGRRRARAATHLLNEQVFAATGLEHAQAQHLRQSLDALRGHLEADE